MKKPFWDVEEDIGFIDTKSKLDNHSYKVWNAGKPETIQHVADILARIRKDLNKLLKYIHTIKDVKNIKFEGKMISWSEHPIAFGIYHCFEIHLPGGDEYSFNYQEMTPNKDGILGLNKPKIIKKMKLDTGHNIVNYEIADKRSIFLTIRPKLSNTNNSNPDILDTYEKILDLALHEITHTVCNDVRWKEDNHKHPYKIYEGLMKRWAKECGVIKIN